jgi:hypothetical protein
LTNGNIEKASIESRKPSRKERKHKHKKQKLSLAIRKLKCEEIEHFLHCNDDDCLICKKVHKAYGTKPIKVQFEEPKKTMEKDTETKLLF